MPYERLKLAQKKTVGTKQTLKACQRKEAKEVFIALDAEAHVIEPVIKLCRGNEIPVTEVNSMRELGRSCGIGISCATAAITKY